ncbi:GNAT family N-acetyltransferase [Actinospica durhamensis]|uniref:GNAT family N-acetyltransferase n=1 Tax=Actinospica durhamensis TaxID=1508375 RepID=A0A941EXK1_9ACTN|nr:GNAT family N-acetyltransferase [Actinospica durhamensis]MBR7839071.1 GNAT family N-acetyltransferase [Actinospica durhamensis]
MTLQGRQDPAVSPWHVTSGEQAPETVERLLRSLPEWFGIDSSIVEYVEHAHRLSTYLAWADRAPGDGAEDGERAAVGVILVARHFPGAAEVYLMAVDSALHRQGVGRSLVRAVEADLIADGVSLLQVKTLGPSRADPHYDRTREFYTSMGFRPLEEIHELWPENPCLVMVKVLQ